MSPEINRSGSLNPLGRDDKPLSKKPTPQEISEGLEGLSTATNSIAQESSHATQPFQDTVKQSVKALNIPGMGSLDSDDLSFLADSVQKTLQRLSQSK